MILSYSKYLDQFRVQSKSLERSHDFYFFIGMQCCIKIYITDRQNRCPTSDPSWFHRFDIGFTDLYWSNAARLRVGIIANPLPRHDNFSKLSRRLIVMVRFHFRFFVRCFLFLILDIVQYHLPPATRSSRALCNGRPLKFLSLAYYFG